MINSIMSSGVAPVLDPYDVTRECKFEIKLETVSKIVVCLDNDEVSHELHDSYLKISIPRSLAQATCFVIDVHVLHGELSIGRCLFNHISKINPFFTKRHPILWQKLIQHDFDIDYLNQDEIELIRKIGIFCPSGKIFDCRDEYRFQPMINSHRVKVSDWYALNAGDSWHCVIWQPDVFVGPTPWAMADDNWNYRGH